MTRTMPGMLFVHGCVVINPDLLVELNLPPGETVVHTPRSGGTLSPPRFGSTLRLIANTHRRIKDQIQVLVPVDNRSASVHVARSVRRARA